MRLKMTNVDHNIIGLLYIYAALCQFLSLLKSILEIVIFQHGAVTDVCVT